MPTQPVVSIKNLNKFFESAQVISNLSLEVLEGEIYGIVGKSGAGKTTLINCLMGLEQPSSGEILIDGKLLSGLQGAELRLLRQKMGVVFQQYPLFTSRTALENVLYPCEISGVQADPLELLDIVGLKGKESCYPKELSGGQRQRVAIARALALNPRLLLCDEPTSALDPETTASLLKLLLKLNYELGITIILITHEMEVVRQICHRVSVLEQGKVVDEGRVLDLFVHPGHKLTKQFLTRLPHTIPGHLHPSHPDARLLHLCFPSTLAEKGLISQMVKRFSVDVNILLGAIDTLLEGSVGNLIIELQGTETERHAALHFLSQQGVIIEEILT